MDRKLLHTSRDPFRPSADHVPGPSSEIQRTPTIKGSGIRVKDVAVADEHSGYGADEMTQLQPDLSLGDVHRALAFYHDHIDEFRSPESTSV